ncbi:MAG: glycosyltransferase, partial [Anaerolineae bacterium]
HAARTIGQTDAAIDYEAQARQLKENIQAHFWQDELGYFITSQRFRNLSSAGNLMAIAWGLATPAQANSIIEKMDAFRMADPVPTQVVNLPYPDQFVGLENRLAGIPEYHTTAAWLWLGAWHVIALARMGRHEAANDLFRRMSDLIVRDGVVHEVRYPAIELPSQYPLTFPVSSFVDTLLPSLKLNVIHAHHPVLIGQAAAHQAKVLNVPLVFTHHTRYQEYSHYVPLPQDLVKKVIDRWVGDFMARCHHIVVPSRSTREILAERYGVTDRVSVVSTGIDPTVFAGVDGRSWRQQQGWQDNIILISAGRLAEEKNWHTLLAAMPPVMGAYPQVKLVILGDGTEREELEDYALELAIANRVQFTGNVPFADVPHYLKAADIFCFASITETQGLVTLEAMAAGLPVVAVRGSGTMAVVDDGVEGIITDNDRTAVANALLSLLGNQERRQQFREAAQKKAAQFDQRAQAKKLLDVYEQAIAAQKSGQMVSIDPHRPIFNFDWQELFT